MKKNVMELISEEKIYPIVRNKDAQKAIDIAHALIEGGIKVMEITIENPSLYKSVIKVCNIFLSILDTLYPPNSGLRYNLIFFS